MFDGCGWEREREREEQEGEREKEEKQRETEKERERKEENGRSTSYFRPDRIVCLARICIHKLVVDTSDFEGSPKFLFGMDWQVFTKALTISPYPTHVPLFAFAAKCPFKESFMIWPER